jgi:hypothetical protein
LQLDENMRRRPIGIHAIIDAHELHSSHSSESRLQLRPSFPPKNKVVRLRRIEPVKPVRPGVGFKFDLRSSRFDSLVTGV